MTIFKAPLLGMIALVSALGLATGCGGGSGGKDRSSDQGTVAPPIVPPLAPLELSSISVFGIDEEQGNFDPAPTVDAAGTIWMSYTHISEATSGKRLIETRIATTADAGLNWQDTGVTVNAATSLSLPPPNNVNAIAHEVSRLVYNPYAETAGAEPWLMVWHRYPGVLLGEDKNFQLLQHGWLALKSGTTATTLGRERKMFTGAAYDTSNNNDSFGPPEFPLDTLFATDLQDCQLFTEPGILPKSEGVYVSLFCAGADLPGKVVLLRCGHDMANCSYLGDLIDGSEASLINTSYSDFSAPELVSVNGQDFLIVSPVSISDDLYRGCMVFKITDLGGAEIERSDGSAVGNVIVAEHGDFNGACGYVEGLTGSGIMMSEAFFGDSLTFGLFATDVQL